MRLLAAPLVAAFALLVGGCASGPSPEVMELQRQNAELKQANEEISRRELAEQAQQDQQKKVEQARAITAKVEAEQDAEHQARFAKDKPAVIAELTRRYAPHRQELLEGLGFSGTVIDYDIDDAVLDGGVLYFEERLVWRKPDSNVGYVANVYGYDLEKDKVVSSRIDDVQSFTQAEYAKLVADDPKTMAAVTAPPPAASPATSASAAPSSAGQEPTFYQRNQQNIEQAAIGVGAAAATYGLEKWIESLFQSDQ